MKRRHLIVLIALTCCMACKQRYDPPLRSSENFFLIVEGNLDPGGDTAKIRLTRSTKLADTSKVVSENKAQLTVEGKDNTIRALTSANNGFYISPNLGLQIGSEYRLRIKMSDGNEYLSDFIMAKKAPPIDSITWGMTADDTALHLYVTGSDPDTSTRYYRWGYDETWEIKSYYHAYAIYKNGIVRERILPQEDVFVCWKYDSAHSITVASSVALGRDIIFKTPVRHIPRDDERLSVRYSILVKQYALDKEGYDFFALMKKNTEELGGLFTPLPSVIRGNIRSAKDPAKEILGYITASTVSTKRIFISTNEVPLWRYYMHPYCDPPDWAGTFSNNISNLRYYFDQMGFMPYDYEPLTGQIFYSKPFCVDCTSRGGSVARPSYW